MSEAMSAPAGGSAASESAPGSGAAGDVGQSGSGDSGYAPGTGQEAVAGEGSAQDTPAVAPPAEFLFGGRKYRDQAHAENAVMAMIGRQPQVQRENAAMQRQLAELQAELQALHALGLGPGSAQGGQGKPTKEEAAALADSLAKNGDLDFIAQLAEDPNIGLKGAMYEMARLFDGRMKEALQNLEQTAIQPILMRNETTTALNRVMGVTRELSQHFPELDPSNESEEAQAAQQEILGIVKTFPPEMLVNNPDFVLGMSVMAYREMYGAPTFAQPPGSSGSPSAFAAEAAEAAANGSVPMDGTGVPRPGSGSDSPLDRIRRDNKAIKDRMARTPSGRPLGFEVL